MFKKSIPITNGTDFIEIEDNESWDLGCNDFTIDCWISFGTVNQFMTSRFMVRR